MGGMTGFLSLTIKNADSLHKAYMPFIKNGGIFMSTANKYHIGDDIFIRLTLMNDPEIIPVAGKVIWITPQGAQNNKQAGIGVQFTKDGDALNDKIKGYLVDIVKEDQQTNTM